MAHRTAHHGLVETAYAPRPQEPDRDRDLVNWRDTGCSLSPSCLRCPLPVCRYDEPAGLATLNAKEKARRIQALRVAGMPADDIAREVGVSRRTVFRLLKRGD